MVAINYQYNHPTFSDADLEKYPYLAELLEHCPCSKQDSPLELQKWAPPYQQTRQNLRGVEELAAQVQTSCKRRKDVRPANAVQALVFIAAAKESVFNSDGPCNPAYFDGGSDHDNDNYAQ